MAEMDLTGYEATRASDLVRVIDRALPDWERAETGPGMWVWRQVYEDEQPWVVVVNALPDRILVPTHVWPAKVGPTLLVGIEGDVFASVTFPDCSDNSEMRKALRVVAVLIPGRAIRMTGGGE